MSVRITNYRIQHDKTSKGAKLFNSMPRRERILHDCDNILNVVSALMPLLVFFITQNAAGQQFAAVNEIESFLNLHK